MSRLDIYLVENGLVRSRSRAVHLIKTGQVRLNGSVTTKQSSSVRPGAQVELLSTFQYVSRGGYKLEAVFRSAGLSCQGKRVLDVGCSTGGFSDFFLQNGAASVVALDIALDIIHPSLLKEQRLIFLPQTALRDREDTARKLEGRSFDIIATDVSNTPLEEVLAGAEPYLAQGGIFVALFKPPYEGGKGAVEEETALELAAGFQERVKERYHILARELSPIRGGSKGRGSRELFFVLRPKTQADGNGKEVTNQNIHIE